jgi:vesicle-fusing ATPase
MDTVHVQVYDPFVQGGQSYLGGMDLEVGFAGKKTSDASYDQDELANYFIKVYFTLWVEAQWRNQE